MSDEKQELLIQYARMVYEISHKFNVTGHKTEEAIYNDLVVGSIEPMKTLNVPRGTLFADIGTGAGVPGIPLAFLWPEASGVLMDSNQKKIAWLKTLIQELNINNLIAVEGRIEHLASIKNYRQSFDYVFSRALGNWHISIEAGGALIKRNGILYIYSAVCGPEIEIRYRNHAEKCGLMIIPVKNHKHYGFTEEGFILQKVNDTPQSYPRRLSAILREAGYEK